MFLKTEFDIFVTKQLKMIQMKNFLVVVVLLVSAIAAAQDMEVVKGDFSAISGQKEFNVIFDYSKMTVLKDRKTEAQYIEERSKELNEKDKGNGEIWKKKWAGAKDGIWTPKFLELVNVVLHKAKKDVLFQEGLASAKYTLLVETVWIYPGYDVYVSKQAARVTTNLRFVETNNKSNVVLEIKSEEAPGSQFGSQFSNENRIGEGFAKTGKSLAQLLNKNAYK